MTTLPNIQTYSIGPQIVANSSIFVASTNTTSYQWYKNGVLIPGATAGSYVTSSIGTYNCHLHNAAGTTISPNIFVYNPVYYGSAFTVGDGNWNNTANWYSYPGYITSNSSIPAVSLGRLPNPATELAEIFNGVVTTGPTTTYAGDFYVSQVPFSGGITPQIEAGTYSGSGFLTGSTSYLHPGFIGTANCTGTLYMLPGTTQFGGGGTCASLGGSAQVSNLITYGSFNESGASGYLGQATAYVSGNVIIGNILSGGIIFDGSAPGSNITVNGIFSRQSFPINPIGSGGNIASTWSGYTFSCGDYFWGPNITYAPTAVIPMLLIGGKWVPQALMPQDPGFAAGGGTFSLANVTFTGLPTSLYQQFIYHEQRMGYVLGFD